MDQVFVLFSVRDYEHDYFMGLFHSVNGAKKYAESMAYWTDMNEPCRWFQDEHEIRGGTYWETMYRIIEAEVSE